MEREGALQKAASAESRTPNVHRAHEPLTNECGWKGDDSLNSARQWWETGRERRIPMFSFARRAFLWLAAAAVKAPYEQTFRRQLGLGRSQVTWLACEVAFHGVEPVSGLRG